MSQFDQLFGDDNYNELNENVDEDNLPGDQSGDENNPDGDEAIVKIKVEPKKPRAVRNPRLVLNPNRLLGERGVHTIEKYFENVKLKGKHHELEDLNIIMKRLEHWAHRLMPRFTFDDSLNKIEKLGRKKQVQTHMYRYRQGMLEVETDKTQLSDDEQEQLRGMDAMDEPVDEMDALLEAQIEKTRHDTSIGSSVMATPKFMAGRPNMVASTPFDTLREEGEFNSPVRQKRPVDHFDTPIPVVKAPVVTQLSAEQLATIAENRRKAQERLKAKKEAESQGGDII